MNFEKYTFMYVKAKKKKKNWNYKRRKILDFGTISTLHKIILKKIKTFVESNFYRLSFV